jgi:hypothetical protein
VDWRDLAQNRDRCLAVLNTVMKLCFHKRYEISSLADGVLASQGGLCSMELASKLRLVYVCS